MLRILKRLKRFFAILALLGVLLQTFSSVVIVAEYYANKNYIAKNLCENRDKPAMRCEGKCCLKKKLAKAGKEQSPSSKNQRSEESVNLFCENIAIDFARSLPVPASIEYHHRDDRRVASFMGSIFHPPGQGLMS